MSGQIGVAGVGDGAPISNRARRVISTFCTPVTAWAAAMMRLA